MQVAHRIQKLAIEGGCPVVTGVLDYTRQGLSISNIIPPLMASSAEDPFTAMEIVKWFLAYKVARLIAWCALGYIFKCCHHFHLNFWLFGFAHQLHNDKIFAAEVNTILVLGIEAKWWSFISGCPYWFARSIWARCPVDMM
jgi:hypothetical protein